MIFIRVSPSSPPLPPSPPPPLWNERINININSGTRDEPPRCIDESKQQYALGGTFNRVATNIYQLAGDPAANPVCIDSSSLNSDEDRGLPRRLASLAPDRASIFVSSCQSHYASPASLGRYRGCRPRENVIWIRSYDESLIAIPRSARDTDWKSDSNSQGVTDVGGRTGRGRGEVGWGGERRDERGGPSGGKDGGVWSAPELIVHSWGIYSGIPVKPTSSARLLSLLSLSLSLSSGSGGYNIFLEDSFSSAADRGRHTAAMPEPLAGVTSAIRLARGAASRGHYSWIRKSEANESRHCFADHAAPRFAPAAPHVSASRAFALASAL